jgi:pseudouridine synthase
MALNRTIRLQKFLAECGVASRRKAEEIIAAGRVSVDGEVVRAMGHKIDPDRQEVRCDDKIVSRIEKPVYILLNKPRGYVTTLADPQGRPIVTSLLKGVTARVFPVGRLDIDTEGALLLTNDGGLTQKVLHPSHQTTKTYEVQVRGLLSQARIDELERGIMLEGRRTWPARITQLTTHNKTSKLHITIHEGRKRQVRNMFQAVGHPVASLKRIAYGQLRLGSLKSGSYRFLTQNELKKIFL